jgi:restriction system protein
MPIPDYQTLMLPVLRLLHDKEDHTLRAVEASMADAFQLTQSERQEMLPSGTQRVLINRVGWSLSYLTKAGLTERVGRGRYRIAPKGVEILQAGIDRIDAPYLRDLGGYSLIKTGKPKDEEGSGPALEPEPPESLLTPEEQMETGYQSARQQLSDEIRERLRAVSPSRFEQLVVDLLVAMGYGGASGEAGQVIGKTGDDGIDGVIKEDKLGLDHVYIQAKRWESNVPRPIVQAFAGSLEGQRTRKGVMITTSDFTKEAQDYVKRIEKRIVLINGELLANYMIDHQIGVATVKTYELKRIDNDYFEEG